MFSFDALKEIYKIKDDKCKKEMEDLKKEHDKQMEELKQKYLKLEQKYLKITDLLEYLYE
jgi:hypothetical protein